MINTTHSNPWSVFVTSDDQILVGNEYSNTGVERWTMNGTRLSSLISLCSGCMGLFVDVNNNLYCSRPSLHQVVSQPLDDPSNRITIVAGTGCSGSDSNMLANPRGIFVTISLDLYVADYDNNRVQLFRRGEVNATTVGVSGSLGAIVLRRPTGVVLDADGYLFIVDSGNNRIVGSGPHGFRCVAGCLGSNGSAFNQLSVPHTLSFDSEGNLFVMDRGNHRLQKFLLSNNTCGE
jgi:DNA-binding beta-propeller fold protein YncE